MPKVSAQPLIFLSHTTRDLRDRKLAHKLADGLRAQNAQVWIAPDSIPTGDNWEKQIVAGIIEKCTHFLVILSHGSAEAKWVKKVRTVSTFFQANWAARWLS